MDGTSYALPRLSVVLPARDEEDNIVRVIESVLELAGPFVSELEVVVVDDGSRDRTAARVRAFATETPLVRLVSHEVGRGYGAALRSGFAASRFEWVFYTDADGQFPMRELPAAIRMIGSAGAVIGYRRMRADPPHRRLLGRAWTSIVRRTTGLHVRDVNCAFKIFPRSVLRGRALRSDGAAISAELLLAIVDAGVSVEELAVEHEARRRGDQSGARASVAFRAVRELASLIRRA